MINNFECGGYKFNANFDSGNLDRVEFVAKHTDGNLIRRSLLRFDKLHNSLHTIL